MNEEQEQEQEEENVYERFVQRQLHKLKSLQTHDKMIAIVRLYLLTLDENEKEAIQLAETLLGSSFDILKSNAFVDFKEKRFSRPSQKEKK